MNNGIDLIVGVLQECRIFVLPYLSATAWVALREWLQQLDKKYA